METRIVSMSSVVVGALAMAVAVSGCFDSGAASLRINEQKYVAPAIESREDFVETALPDWYRGEKPILRFRTDAARDRLWVLTLDGVEVYEVATRRKLTQIALSGWIWVDEQYSCPPDLTLGPKGEALISSNVVPTLWRVDPVTLAASQHDLVLDQDTDRDIGFSGMTYSAEQGIFFAVSNLHGSLWRIDPLLKRAQKIPISTPVPSACSLSLRAHGVQRKSTRLVGLCVHGVKDGRAADLALLLAADQRSGYVVAGACAG